MSKHDVSLSPEDREHLLGILQEEVKTLIAERNASTEPCPDSSVIVGYVLGHLDLKQTQAVSRHLVLCTRCFDDLLALLGPEKVTRMLDGETVIGIDLPVPASWHQWAERAAQAVVELGRNYAPGTVVGPLRILVAEPAVAVRGAPSASLTATVFELPIGGNVYGVSLTIGNGKLTVDFAGYKIATPLSAEILLYSADGHTITSAKTDAYGNAHIIVQDPPSGTLAVVLTLEKEAWEAFSIEAVIGADEQ